MSRSLCSVYGRFYYVQDSLPYVNQSVFSLSPFLLCSRQSALCPPVCVKFMAASIMYKIVYLMSTSLCSVYGRFHYVQDSLPYVQQSVTGS